MDKNELIYKFYTICNSLFGKTTISEEKSSKIKEELNAMLAESQQISIEMNNNFSK